MAVTVSIEKARVVYFQPGLWNIMMHLTARDTGTDVIDKDYSAAFRKGDDFISKSKVLTEKMQADIDQYYSEQLIFNNSDMTELTNAVRDGLDLEEPNDLEIRRGTMQKEFVAKKVVVKKTTLKKVRQKKTATKSGST